MKIRPLLAVAGIAVGAAAGMLTTKHAARAMVKAGTRGSIIHLLSTAAHFGEASGSAYCAAKAALGGIGLMMSISTPFGSAVMKCR